MTNKELTKLIAKNLNLSQVNVKAVLDNFKEVVTATVVDEPVYMHKFGIFKTLTRKSRNGVNPQTQAKIVVPEKKVVRFLASESMKNSVN